MITKFNKRFLKDLEKITQPAVKEDILEVIVNTQKVNTISEIKNIKKLKGHFTAYRVRIGDYRIGLYIEENVVEFNRIAHRKDIYKIFP